MGSDLFKIREGIRTKREEQRALAEARLCALVPEGFESLISRHSGWAVGVCTKILTDSLAKLSFVTTGHYSKTARLFRRAEPLL